LVNSLKKSLFIQDMEAPVQQSTLVYDWLQVWVAPPQPVGLLLCLTASSTRYLLCVL